MGLLQKHAILTAVGLILSILAVAWLQPISAGGTTFVVVFLLIVVNAVGAVIIRTGPTTGEKDSASAHLDT
jgi:hypothetical protein